VGRRRDGLEAANNGRPGTFITMDAADHEKLALGGRIATPDGRDPPPEHGAAEQDTSTVRRLRRRDPHVHVVVVVSRLTNDLRGAREPRARPDEDELGPGADEAAHEVLRERAIDLRRHDRLAFPAVPARVVDVGVESVLVGEMAEAAEAGAELPAVRTAQIADADARRAGVRGSKLGHDA
jgi:hypothetical protein